MRTLPWSAAFRSFALRNMGMLIVFRAGVVQEAHSPQLLPPARRSPVWRFSARLEAVKK
jgi:hypothetical protein